MEFEIESRRENKLLDREEIKLIVKFEGSTPNRKKIKEAIKKEFNINGFIVINDINSYFGVKQAKVYAKIYPTEKTAQYIENSYRIKRDQKTTKGEQQEKQKKPKEEPQKEETEKPKEEPQKEETEKPKEEPQKEETTGET